MGCKSGREGPISPIRFLRCPFRAYGIGLDADTIDDHVDKGKCKIGPQDRPSGAICIQLIDIKLIKCIHGTHSQTLCTLWPSQNAHTRYARYAQTLHNVRTAMQAL